MARKITKLGHTVKGALAAYLVPRIAADKALKPGELHKLLMDVKPAPFKTQQVKPLADSVKALLKDRLAKDADVEDLAELLEALGGESDLDDDGEEMEDRSLTKDEDDMGMDADPGEQLMKMLSGYQIPESDLEKINSLITQLGTPKAAADAGKAKDEFGKGGEAKPGKPAEKENGAPMKEVPVTKPALDARLKTEGERIAKDTRTQLAGLFNAARDVEPVLGRVDALAFDSAEALYKLALDQRGVKTEGVHPSAYKALLDLSLASEANPVAPTVAADASSYKDFTERYPNIPAQA